MVRFYLLLDNILEFAKKLNEILNENTDKNDFFSKI